MRQRFQESLGETSGAVEIEVEQLDRFERGAELPTEDVLMLLISHFGLQDDEAVELWELAGYDSSSEFGPGQYDDDRPHNHRHTDQSQADNRQGTPVMLLAFDNRVLYSNDIELVSDASGVVVNFMQTGDKKTDNTAQRIPVSRIGMSYEQTERLMQALQHLLLNKKYSSGPKQLPPPQQ